MKSRTAEVSRPNRAGLLLLLIGCAVLLAGRLLYLYLANVEHFPISTIKVAASYQHVTHNELEAVLAKHLNSSFFFLSVTKLQDELNAMNWIDTAVVKRVWPDTLRIKLVEKQPVAIWDNALMTKDGALFNQGAVSSDIDIPRLTGPQDQQLVVLQIHDKLNKILSAYGLNATGLSLSDNQSWMLILGSGIKIYLGKKELEARLLRFCKAYPAVFAEKVDQLASVDLRYPRGMAVQWKQQTGR
ncbi:MAG: cell division protein FtsQ/DivIB [Legionellales bacterium]